MSVYFNYNVPIQFKFFLFTIAPPLSLWYLRKRRNGEKNYESTKDYAEKNLFRDSRVDFYCGKNFYLFGVGTLWKNSYSFYLKGINDQISEVIVDSVELTHKDLLSLSNYQIYYSKLSQANKKEVVYKPLDFNNYIIPTAKTFKKINDLLLEQNIKIEDLLSHLNHLDYIQGKYHDNKSELAQALNVPIDPSDNFHVIYSQKIYFNKNHIIKLIPADPKYRTYKLEDTTYPYITYFDILQHYCKNYPTLIENGQLLSEMQRSNSGNKLKKIEKVQPIKNFTLSEMYFFYITLLFFLYPIIINNKVNLSIFYNLQKRLSMIKDNKIPRKGLLCISQNQSLITGNYKVYGLISSNKGNKTIVEFKVDNQNKFSDIKGSIINNDLNQSQNKF